LGIRMGKNPDPHSERKPRKNLGASAHSYRMKEITLLFVSVQSHVRNQLITNPVKDIAIRNVSITGEY